MPRRRSANRPILPSVVLLAGMCALALLIPARAIAQPRDYLIDAWDPDRGLPSSLVTSVAQTPEGYLWVATQNGLLRFDGLRFVGFDPDNTPQLKHARGRAPLRRRRRDAVDQHLRRVHHVLARRRLPAGMGGLGTSQVRGVSRRVESRRDRVRPGYGRGDPANAGIRDGLAGAAPAEYRPRAALRRGRRRRALDHLRRRPSLAPQEWRAGASAYSWTLGGARAVPGERCAGAALGRHRRRSGGLRRRPLPHHDAAERRVPARRVAADVHARRRPLGGGQRPRQKGPRPRVGLGERYRQGPDRSVPPVAECRGGSPRRSVAVARRQGPASRAE